MQISSRNYRLRTYRLGRRNPSWRHVSRWILAGMLSIQLCASVSAATIFVDVTATGQNDGTSWVDAFPWLQDAVTAAGATDEIWVASGTYKPDIVSGAASGLRDDNFVLKNNVGIYGGFFGTETLRSQRDPVTNVTILSGDLAGNDLPGFVNRTDNSYHVAIAPFNTTTAILDGFTIRGGHADLPGSQEIGAGLEIQAGAPTIRNIRFEDNFALAGGGGVRCDGTTAQLTDCVFDGNSSDFGAGSSTIGGAPVFTRCVYQNNVATTGGGAADNAGGTSPTYTDCTFRGNSATFSGATNFFMINVATLTGCIFENNQSANDNCGGAIGLFDGGTANVTGCTFTSNTGADGGAICSARTTVFNCTDSVFTGNVATGLNVPVGGAVTLFQAGASVFDGCTFDGNHADWDAGAIAWEDLSPLTIRDCVFNANTSDNTGGAIRGSLASQADVVTSTFTGNSALFGGAVGANGTTVSIVNCSFDGNNAANDGGALQLGNAASANVVNSRIFNNVARGVHAPGGTPPFIGGGIQLQDAGTNVTVVNSTIAGNRMLGTGPTDGGGGIGANAGTSVTLTNSIVWDNFATTSSSTEDEQVHLVGGATATVDYSIIQGFATLGGMGNSASDPLFIDSVSGNLELLPGSSAIDIADSTPFPADTFDIDGDADVLELIPWDVAGNPRFLDDLTAANTGPGAVTFLDAGAYEFFTDCDDNGVPDPCDLSCLALAGACNAATCGTEPDCNSNGVIDACELAACLAPPACDDCNSNGILDECDIASGFSLDVTVVDGIPDSCVTANPLGGDWDADIWSLAGQFPDNNTSAADLTVTLDNTSVFLNLSVEVDALRLLSGATLDITQTATGDMTIAGTGNLSNSGSLLVANDRNIDVSGGEFLVATGGRYETSVGAGVQNCPTAEVCASVVAGTVRLTGRDCDNAIAGGSVRLDQNMSMTVLGDLIIEGSVERNCNPFPLAQRGVTPPTKFIRGDSALLIIDGELLLSGAGQFSSGLNSLSEGTAATATSGVHLRGNFNNQGVFPSLFDWTNGSLRLEGSSPQVFEVAGLDIGPSRDAFGTTLPTLFDNQPHSNFSIGVLEVAASTSVTFVNEKVNTAGAGACLEALYVDTLVLEAGATVTMDDVNVFYNTLVDNGATINLSGCATLRAACSAPTPVAGTLTKNRYLTVTGGAASFDTALRVTFTQLPPPFDALDGLSLWVGPPVLVTENSGNVNPIAGFDSFLAASLQCAPFYADWSAMGPVHVWHEAIRPGGLYGVQAIETGCLTTDNNNFSPSLPVEMARWGDLVAPFDINAGAWPGPDSVVSLPFDVVAILEKFSNVASAPTKARADLEPAVPNRVIDVADTSRALDAFSGSPYPFAPPVINCP